MPTRAARVAYGTGCLGLYRQPGLARRKLARSRGHGYEGKAVQLLFDRALLPSGIAANVLVSVAPDGNILAVEPAHAGADNRPAPTRMAGLAIPGMPNLHSHAFQRGFAGTAEAAAATAGSFWSWRSAMYRFVGKLGPEDLGAIAAFAYLEMIEAGYTSVAEFHYLHHQPNGRPYSQPATLAQAVRAAARSAGLRQLLLPCLYQRSGFGAADALAEQQRFVCDNDSFMRLFEQLRAGDGGLDATGVALHSLWAVPLPALRAVLAALPRAIPLHIHIAEQLREVEECVQFSRRRPIEYLIDTSRPSINIGVWFMRRMEPG